MIVQSSNSNKTGLETESRLALNEQNFHPRGSIVMRRKFATSPGIFACTCLTHMKATSINSHVAMSYVVVQLWENGETRTMQRKGGRYD